MQMIIGSNDTKVKDQYPFKYSLDVGNEGVQVLMAQSTLANLGLYDGRLDGKYDRSLALAVRAFQSQHDIPITGIIDRRTWNLL